MRVLFLCTHNSARSQMAEAFLRRPGADCSAAHSARTDRATRVHPPADAAMREAGVPLAGQRPKPLDPLCDQRWDDIITTCDRANEDCPAFPGDAERIPWGFDDPAQVVGTEDGRLRAFRRVRDEIRRRVQLFALLRVHREPAGQRADLTL